MRGVLFVRTAPRGYKGTTDLLQEALSTWVPGRRSNPDLSEFSYEATIAELSDPNGRKAP